MLLHWMQQHLKKQPQEDLLSFAAWAMFDKPFVKLGRDNQDVVTEFVTGVRQTCGALDSADGGSCYHLVAGLE